jgi:hypothetical protein
LSVPAIVVFRLTNSCWLRSLSLALPLTPIITLGLLYLAATLIYGLNPGRDASPLGAPESIATFGAVAFVVATALSYIYCTKRL